MLLFYLVFQLWKQKQFRILNYSLAQCKEEMPYQSGELTEQNKKAANTKFILKKINA